MCWQTITDLRAAEIAYIFGHFKPLPSSWVFDAACCFIGIVASHIYSHVSKCSFGKFISPYILLFSTACSQNHVGPGVTI